MRSYKELRQKEYLMPVSVVEKSDNVVGEENLLKEFLMQHVMSDDGNCVCQGRGYIILDFGREYFGSARLMFRAVGVSGCKPCIRLRFGESLMECCSDVGEKNSTNDHSTRDMTFYMSGNSDMEWGMTAYRFIRIDFLEDETYRLARVYGVYVHTDPPKGSFWCDNQLVNDIYETAAHTLHLNMQNCIWDGIKRDQHVWAGDLYPELLGILYLYGDCREIGNTLDVIIRYAPEDRWYNNLPSYNVWFLLTLKEYFIQTGNVRPEYMQAAIKNLRLLEKCINEDGTISIDKAGLYYSKKDFFDWPSNGLKDSVFACYALTYYTLKEISSCGYFDGEMRALAKKLADKLSRRGKESSSFKAITAIGLLVDKCEKEESLKFLRAGGAKGYSAFLSYFISKALADNGYVREAYENNLEYYGGMLKMGATSFWEGFDVEWMENACKITERPKAGQLDVHGDFGKDCYVGFRHSLCHGWSCGVLPFLVEYVVGFRFKEDDCTKIILRPNLCGLKHVKCAVPTVKGLVKIEYVVENGKTEKRVELPEGITLVDERG